FALAQLADAEINRTFRNAHLDRTVVKIEKRKSGHAGHVNCGLTSLKFGPCIFFSPDLVADSYGDVALGTSPVALSIWLKRNRTICVADASHARWRVAFISLGGLNAEAKKTEQRKQQTKAAYPAGFRLHDISPILRPVLVHLV